MWSELSPSQREVVRFKSIICLVLLVIGVYFLATDESDEQRVIELPEPTSEMTTSIPLPDTTTYKGKVVYPYLRI